MRPGRRAAHTQDVDAPGSENQIDGLVKGLAVNSFQSVLELFHVRMQDRPQDVFMSSQLGRGAQPLDGGQLFLELFLEDFLEMGVTFKAELHGKTDDSRFADADLLANPCCCQVGRQVIMFKYTGRSPAALCSWC